ncbi:MAG: endonuclease domain-containing protein [Actinomycetota bacterium]|nr:endonuclease domain-containing protein [Actinomycetota bacterium]
MLIESGLPTPELQHVVVDTTGFIARVDLANPQHMIAIEYDGAVHRNSDVFIQDLRRQNRLVAAGWSVLRFSGSDVLSRPADVVSQVLQARLAAVRTRAAS